MYPFREHWDKSRDDLVIDAVKHTLDGVNLASEDIDAYWIGTAQSGMSGLTLSMPLKLEGKPVTRVKELLRYWI